MKSSLYSSLILLLIISAPCHGDAQVSSPADTKKTVAVDPGHGGQDTGVRGTGSSIEKNITLSFARAIESRLSQKYTLFLCRTSDDMSDSRSRVESANRAKADILISVHTGGSYIHEPHGIGIYYHEPASTLISKPTMITDKSNDHGEPLPWNSVQDKYSLSSRSLASAIYERLSRNQTHGRIRMAGLPLFGFSGANMPSVLIEIGELNNPADEKLLNTTAYMNTLADEIGQGINNFFSRYSSPAKHEPK